MPSRTRVRIVASLLIGTAAIGPAWADDTGRVRVLAGGSVTTRQRWTAAAFVDGVGRTHDWRGIHWQPMASVGWVRGRRDDRDGLDHDVVLGAAGVRLVDWWGGAFASLQLGAAAGRTDALSSTGQFVSSLGWQGRRWELMLRHVSNGRLVGGGRNLGETMFLVGLRF